MRFINWSWMQRRLSVWLACLLLRLQVIFSEGHPLIESLLQSTMGYLHGACLFCLLMGPALSGHLMVHHTANAVTMTSKILLEYRMKSLWFVRETEVWLEESDWVKWFFPETTVWIVPRVTVKGAGWAQPTFVLTTPRSPQNKHLSLLFDIHCTETTLPFVQSHCSCQRLLLSFMMLWPWGGCVLLSCPRIRFTELHFRQWLSSKILIYAISPQCCNLSIMCIDKCIPQYIQHK